MIDEIANWLNTPDDEGSDIVSADSQRKKHDSIIESPEGSHFVVFDDVNPDEQTEIRLTRLLDFSDPHLVELKKQALKDELVAERAQIDINNNRRGSKLFNEGVKYGAQAGLKSTIDTFRESVTQLEYAMSQVYNFESVMIGEGKVFPPVITMRKGLTEISEDKKEHRYINTRYKPHQQAKFEETTRTFRSYLDVSEQEIKLPSIYSIPLNDVELTYWSNGVYEGWARGQKLGGQELDNAIAKLKRDWLGIKRYEALVLQGIMSPPVVREARNNVEGYSDGMDVGIKILKINALPEFEINPSNWNVLPRLDNLEAKMQKRNKTN